MKSVERHNMKENPENWKLKLRYGKLKTPYKHYTIIADGDAGTVADGFECPPGRAFMSMKAWATDDNEAADMIQAIGQQIGFTVDGDIQLYDTDPEEPPSDNPRGYHISFNPYE